MCNQNRAHCGQFENYTKIIEGQLEAMKSEEEKKVKNYTELLKSLSWIQELYRLNECDRPLMVNNILQNKTEKSESGM